MTPFRHSTALSILSLVQGGYYVLTGLWPLLHIQSFMWVTGPKIDVWLVKTVGLLVLVIGIVFLSASTKRRISPEIFLLAVGSAASLTFIDVYYAWIDRISNIYLLDAILEIILVLGWWLSWAKAKR